MADSTKIKYLMSVVCDQTPKNYKNVTTICKSTFPEVGYLEVKEKKQFHQVLKNNGWEHHGWDYWRCPSCENS